MSALGIGAESSVSLKPRVSGLFKTGHFRNGSEPVLSEVFLFNEGERK